MTIEVGSKLEGKVTGITHFGAFVLLPGGVTGLVHISEISHNYVKDIHDHLKINDSVTVKVIHVDKDGKIGLSIRQAMDNPNPSPGGRRRPGGRYGGGSRQSFEDKLLRFMKDSEERLQALRRSESKRGGRGGRRG
ncbi:S1 domain-containing RNA-binding protein [Alicyclobacillus macrosporangiidus]|jgi:S1 RNA binding domain protein|uniref:S1 RNA binding domain protein n=1 Tax=Alicyclobacillus macrosporangiidus TaxID=392015 RepID=A0A1I7KQI9_9BACL|nr:S1 domain-containing RNA-binding protein [Alicyclobacillus macrosporangiidus]SFU99712.1 S1 RNA binding domain protein [Alicyclobacillus macrosporangiidus]